MPRLLIASTVPVFMRAFLMPFVEHFRARGWRVDGMANAIKSDPECVAGFDSVWDVSWSRNPLDHSNFRYAPQQVRKIVDHEAYDIVHVHTPVASLVCRYALRHHTASVRICTVHGFHFHEHGTTAKNALFLGLEKCAGRWTDYLVVINKADEAAAKKNRLVPLNRLIYMPGIGVDTLRKYNPAAIDSEDVMKFRRSLGAGYRDPVVLMLAEFIPRKRHSDALRAWKELGCAKAHLVLAGIGPTQEAMVNLSVQLGLERQVHFVGVRSDIPVLLAASQAVLLCSDQEGLPRSVMEALSLECPVIGSDIRGTRELLQEGAGYLYPVRDIQALAGALRHVIHNPSEAASRAKLGRKRMAAYDLRHILNQHEDLYATALGMRPSAARTAS